jgi:hypothetical protein
VVATPQLGCAHHRQGDVQAVSSLSKALPSTQGAPANERSR